MQERSRGSGSRLGLQGNAVHKFLDGATLATATCLAHELTSILLSASSQGVNGEERVHIARADHCDGYVVLGHLCPQTVTEGLKRML